jgi:N-acetylneuraminic acid mutarotase
MSLGATAWLRGRLYMTGGFMTSKQVLCWDPTGAGGWQRLANLLTGRMKHTAVVLRGALYVLGGYGAPADNVGRSVERYDPGKNVWEAVAPMSTARRSFAAAVLDGRIIVVGGEDDDGDDLRSCERFDPGENVWETLHDITTARYSPAATVLGGRLWVTGGYHRPFVGDDAWGGLATVEVFDPATNTWDQSKASLNNARFEHALAVLHGDLYAIGGHRETSVEKYDAQADSWTFAVAMALPYFCNGASWAVRDCYPRKIPKKAARHRKLARNRLHRNAGGGGGGGGGGGAND